MKNIEEIISSIFAIFIVIILAGAFTDVIRQVNPNLVIVFIIAIILIIIGIVRRFF